MRCAACSHASPFAKAWSMPLEMVKRDLESLKPFIYPESINIVGGEPLLHPNLVDLMRIVSEIRIDTEHVVITNGKLLPKMSEEFWDALECLSISVYSTLDVSVLELAKAKEKQYGFRLIIQEFPEFFQQFDVVPDGSSFHDCPWKTDCYTVHDGYFFLCPQSTFFPSSFMGLPAIVDGLSLEGITEEKLESFMHRNEPLNACRTCRAYGPKIPWHESKTRAEWLNDSTITHANS